MLHPSQHEKTLLELIIDVSTTRAATLAALLDLEVSGASNGTTTGVSRASNGTNAIVEPGVQTLDPKWLRTQ